MQSYSRRALLGLLAFLEESPLTLERIDLEDALRALLDQPEADPESGIFRSEN